MFCWKTVRVKCLNELRCNSIYLSDRSSEIFHKIVLICIFEMRRFVHLLNINCIIAEGREIHWRLHTKWTVMNVIVKCRRKLVLYNFFFLILFHIQYFPSFHINKWQRFTETWFCKFAFTCIFFFPETSKNPMGIESKRRVNLS